MILFTNLFTLQGSDPYKNHYVYMLPMLVETLKRTGTYLPDQDSLYILTDAETEKVISQFNMESLRQRRCIVLPQPKTLLEGCANRYRFFHHIYEPDVTTLYLDLDMLCVRQFRPEVPPDTLALLPEGDASNSNYCGHDTWASLDHPGFTSGFWAVRIGPKTLAVMNAILDRIATEPQEFYTLDQVYFNACISTKDPIVGINPAIVSFNGDADDMTHVHFLNLAGQPGNGPAHFIQMMNAFCSIL